MARRTSTVRRASAAGRVWLIVLRFRVRVGVGVGMGVRVGMIVAVVVSRAVLVLVLLLVFMPMIHPALSMPWPSSHVRGVALTPDRSFAGQSASAILTHQSISKEATSISRPARSSPLGL